MAEGRGRLEWAQTSELLAMIHNRAGMGSTEPVSSCDFNPYAVEQAGEVAIQVDKCLQHSILVPDLTPEQRKKLAEYHA